MSENQKAVYGPVKSWRFGLSLGIDPIFEISTCSFNCIYCQLGNIQRVTSERKVFISTEKVINDFQDFKDKDFSVITFSGSGEPTLALNLGDIAKEIKLIKPNMPLLCLTNSTLLFNKSVRTDLNLMDRVIVKLDAVNDKSLQIMNRPAENIHIKTIIEGIKLFKRDYTGILDIQIMFMPNNLDDLEELANILNEIKPDTVQLNTPQRPYPLSWNRDSRGNHVQEREYETRKLKVISEEEAKNIEQKLRNMSPNLNILSIYHE